MSVGSTGLFLVATAIWGSTWLAITYQLGVVAPQVSVAYRFALASLCIAAWCAARGQSLRFARRDHVFLAGMGATMFGLNYVCVYLAERLVTSGLVAVVFSTIVFMGPVASRIVFGTALRPRTLVAATLGVAGVALLFLPELDAVRQGGSTAWGVAFALLATVVATCGNLFAVRNHNRGLPTFPVTAWGMAYGAAVAALTALAAGVPWTFDPRQGYVLSLAYLTLFGSIAAFGAYLTLLKRVGMGTASFVGVATPVIAMLVSTVGEGYRWTWVAALGVVLSVTGNVIALRAATALPPARRR